MTSDPDTSLHESIRARGFVLAPKPLNLAKLRAIIEQIARQ